MLTITAPTSGISARQCFLHNKPHKGLFIWRYGSQGGGMVCCFVLNATNGSTQRSYVRAPRKEGGPRNEYIGFRLRSVGILFPH